MSKFDELRTAFSDAQRRYSAGKTRMEQFVKQLHGQFSQHLGFPGNAVALFSIDHPDRVSASVAPDQALTFDEAHQVWHFGLAFYPDKNSNQQILIHLFAAASDDQKVRARICGQEQQFQVDAGQTSLPLATYIADVAAGHLRQISLPGGGYVPIKVGMD